MHALSSPRMYIRYLLYVLYVYSTYIYRLGLGAVKYTDMTLNNTSLLLPPLFPQRPSSHGKAPVKLVPSPITPFSPPSFPLHSRLASPSGMAPRALSRDSFLTDPALAHGSGEA